MAWRNNKNEEVSLEDLGVKDVDELKTRLAKVAELEATNATLSATSQTQAGELNTLKASLADLEGRVSALPPQNNNNGGNGNNGRVEIPSVADDENAAFAVRMAPLQEQQMVTTAMIVEDRVLRRLAAADPLFPKLEAEVRQLISGTALQLRANTAPQKDNKTIAEQVIENAYLIVKGRHADQIRIDTLAGKGEFFLEPARSSTSSVIGSQTPTDLTVTTLSEDDKKVIAKMGIKPETYVQLVNQGGPNMGGALQNKVGF